MAKIKVIVNAFLGGHIQISLKNIESFMHVPKIVGATYESSQQFLRELNKTIICKKGAPSNRADPTFVRWIVESFADSKFKNEKPTANEVAYIAQKVATKFGYDFESDETPELTERLKQMGIN